MNGNLMYEMARQRVTEQQRTARQAGEARVRRAIARGRHARAAGTEAPVLPAIPDYAHELFASAAGASAAGNNAAGGAVPAARTGCDARHCDEQTQRGER